MAVNKYICVGNLTRDAELKRTGSGMSVLDFGLAVNDGRTNKQTGEWEETPVFWDCTLFGSRGEKLADSLKKGTKVTVEAKVRQNNWVKDGQKRSKHDLIVDNVEFMSRGQQRSGYDDYHGNVRKQQAEYVQATYYDDDCPF